MDAVLASFAALFDGGGFPELSDNVIDTVEDFLLYASDSCLETHVDNLIAFFVKSLSQFLQMEPRATLPYSKYEDRLLRALRFFRPRILKPERSAQLEGIAFQYLESGSDSRKATVYVFLVDHFMTAPPGFDKRLRDLVQWTLTYLGHIASGWDFEENLLMTVVSSLRVLIELSDVCLEAKKVELACGMLAICQLFLFPNSKYDHDFLMAVTAKGFRLCARIVEKYQIGKEVMNSLIPVHNTMSQPTMDNVRNIRIYENFLVLCCSVVSSDDFDRHDFGERVIYQVLDLVEFLVQSPFTKSKRAEIYLRAVVKWCSKNHGMSARAIVMKVWPLIGNFQCPMETLIAAFDVIQTLYTSNAMLEAPSFHVEMLEQLVSVLELMKIDLDATDLTKPAKIFEVKNWLKCNLRTVKLIFSVVSVNFMRANEEGASRIDLSMASSLHRLFKYISYLLDVSGAAAPSAGTASSLVSNILHQIHPKEFRTKMVKIFGVFVQILARLPLSLLSYLFSVGLIDLLPVRKTHTLNAAIFHELVKTLPQPYLLYLAFFQTITKNFDKLFLPVDQKMPLLDMTRVLFQNALKADETAGNTPEAIFTPLCNEIYRFMLLAMSAKHYVLLELLLTMLHGIFQHVRTQQPRLSHFVSKLQQSGFSMHVVLQALAEDPQLESIVSLVALFLYRFCQHQDDTEQWVQLFLPALESETKIMTAIPALIQYTSPNFASWTSQLKEPVRSRFVAALAAPISKASHKELGLLRSLVSKIPGIATELSLAPRVNKNKLRSVVYDGVVICIDTFFEAIKKEGSTDVSDLQTLGACLCELVEQQSFVSANSDSLVCQISEYIAQRSPEVFLSIIELAKSDQTKWTCLFLQYRYLHTPLDQIQSLERKSEFINNVCGLCYNRTTAGPAVSLLGEIMDEVPMGPDFVRVTCGLVHAAQFEFKAVRDIIRKSVFERSYEGANHEIAVELCHHLSAAAMLIPDKMRKVALESLKFFKDKYNIVSRMESGRQALFGKLRSLLQGQRGAKYPTCLRLEFLFNSPFTDVKNPQELIREMMDFLRTLCVDQGMGNTPKLFLVPPEVQRLFKSLECQDPNMMYYVTARFALKLIAKLLAVITDAMGIMPVWEKVLFMLRDEKFRQFVPYFLAKLKKEAKTTAPSYLTLPPTFFGQCCERVKQAPALPEEVMILRFICKQMKDISQHMAFVQYLQLAIQSVRKSSVPQTRSRDQYTLRQIFKFTSVLKQQECYVDMSGLARDVLELIMGNYKYLLSGDIGIQYFANAWAGVFCNRIVEALQSVWSLNLFFVIGKLLTLKGMKLFKIHIAQKICSNIDAIKAFLYDPRRQSEIEQVMPQLLLMMAAIWDMDEEENDVGSLLMINKELFSICYERVHGLQTCFLPSAFVCSLQIFLPIKYAGVINANREFLQIFRDEFVVKMITCVDHEREKCRFLHPTFNRRFLQFMSLLDHENRNFVYSVMETLDCHGCARILLNQLLSDRYQAFPLDTPKHIRVGFQHYPSGPMFYSMLMHYSGCCMGAGKNVVLDDLDDIPILNVNAFVHSLCLRNQIVGIASIKSLTRFLHILKQLSPADESEDLHEISDEFVDTIPQLLDRMPYMLDASLLCFRYLGLQTASIDHTMRAILQFILGFSTSMLNPNARNLDRFIFVMPHVFRQLLSKEVQGALSNRVFEMLIYSVVLALNYVSKSTSNGGLIAQTMEAFRPSVSMDAIDQRILSELKHKLTVDTERTPGQSVNPKKMKFVFHIFPVISDLLVSPTAPPFFPSCLAPVSFFPLQQSRDVVVLYQRALRAVYVSGGLKIGKFIAEEMYNVLKVSTNVITGPLRTPFASVVEWMNQVPKEKNYLSNLRLMMEVLKPRNPVDLLLEISALKQPLHPMASIFLHKTIIEDFPEYVGACAKQPNTMILFLQQTHDLVLSCWQTDWWSLVEDWHLPAFALLLLPKEISKWIWHWNSNQVKNMVIRALHTMEVPYGFNRFVQYYVHYFPSSTLSEALTITLMPQREPFPTLPLFLNMSFLEQCNLCEDALGLMCDRFRFTTDAVGFHQMNDYQAARFYYLREMENHSEDFYFHGLLRVRTLSINLTLPATQNLESKILTVQQESSAPLRVLPFFQDSQFQSGPQPASERPHYVGHWTSFLSSCFVPFFVRSALASEVHLCMSVMQRRNMNLIPDLLKIANVLAIKTLDKQMMMSSTLTWRLSNLTWFLHQNDQDPNALVHVQETVSHSKLALVRMLATAGDVKGALRLLPSSSDKIEVRPFRVTDLNMPRVFVFLNASHTQFSRLRFDAAILVRNYHEALMLMKNALYLDEKKLWTQFVVQLLNTHSSLVSGEHIVMDLISQMSKAVASKLDLYLALLVNVARESPRLVEVMWNTLSVNVNEFSPMYREAWFRWLPILLQSCKRISEAVITALIKWNPSKFALLHKHLTFTKSHRQDMSMDEFTRVMEKEARIFSEFKNAFEWLNSQEIQDDAIAFERRVVAHARLYESLARNAPPRIDEILKGFAPEELGDFCAQNPPFFKTNVQIPDYKTVTGFRFPINQQICLSMQLDADGEHEARLMVICMKGELHWFSLVSPLVYNMNWGERVLMDCLSRHINNAPSSKSRTIFTKYPEAYMIHKSLMLISLPATISGIHELIQPFNLTRLLASAKTSALEDDNSPAAQLDKRTTQVPKDMLFRWLLDGTDNGQLDFLVMRQSLASHFACYSYLKFIFQTPYLLIPSFMFCSDRQRMFLPGFIDDKHHWTVVYPALTEQIQMLFPSFVLRGSYAATWHTMASTFASRRDTIRVYLRAVLPEQMIPRMIDRVMKRSVRAAVGMNSETDKCEHSFAFALFDHLVDVSNNAVRAQMNMIAWI